MREDDIVVGAAGQRGENCHRRVLIGHRPWLTSYRAEQNHITSKTMDYVGSLLRFHFYLSLLARSSSGATVENEFATSSALKSPTVNIVQASNNQKGPLILQHPPHPMPQNLMSTSSAGAAMSPNVISIPASNQKDPPLLASSQHLQHPLHPTPQYITPHAEFSSSSSNGRREATHSYLLQEDTRHARNMSAKNPAPAKPSQRHSHSAARNRKEEVTVGEVRAECESPIRFETSDPNGHNWIWDRRVLQDENMTSWFNLTSFTSREWLDFKQSLSQSSFFSSMPRVYHVSAYVLEGLKSPEMMAILKDYRNTTTMYNGSAPLADHDNQVLRSVYKLMFKDEGGYDLLKKERRMAVFSNVRANQYGLIQDNATCKVVRNGGCTYMSHGKIYKLSGRAKYYNASQPVIQLGAGASGTYHFLMELLVGLAGVDNETLSKAKIHVPSRSGFMVEWLLLVGVKYDQIIDHPHIFAKKLLVPEMGCCGMPWYEQLEWLSHKALSSVAGQIPLRDRPKIVLIKRSVHRTAPNFEDVQRAVVGYATSMNYIFELHDDKKLPSVREQVVRFATADIVVSTHGAGQNFINFMPRHGCVLDFSLKGDPWTIYSRIAYLRKVSYLYFEHPDRRINMTILDNGLRICSEAIRGVNVRSTASAAGMNPEMKRGVNVTASAASMNPEKKRGVNVTASAASMNPEMKRGVNVTASAASMNPEMKRGVNVTSSAASMNPEKKVLVVAAGANTTVHSTVHSNI